MKLSLIFYTNFGIKMEILSIIFIIIIFCIRYSLITTCLLWQELDRVCNESNWVLPTYRVFTSDGKII